MCSNSPPLDDNIFSDVTFDENGECPQELTHANAASTLTDNHIDFQEVKDFDPSVASPKESYLASKAIAENIFWEAAGRNPTIDFTSSKHLLHSIIYLNGAISPTRKRPRPIPTVIPCSEKRRRPQRKQVPLQTHQAVLGRKSFPSYGSRRTD